MNEWTNAVPCRDITGIFTLSLLLRRKNAINHFHLSQYRSIQFSRQWWSNCYNVWANMQAIDFLIHTWIILIMTLFFTIEKYFRGHFNNLAATITTTAVISIVPKSYTKTVIMFFFKFFLLHLFLRWMRWRQIWVIDVEMCKFSWIFYLKKSVLHTHIQLRHLILTLLCVICERWRIKRRRRKTNT